MIGVEVPKNAYNTSLIMTVVQSDVNFDDVKAMWFSLERKLQIPLEEDILDPNEEPQVVMEHPEMEDQRGGKVETSIQAEPSIEGKKGIREVDR